MRSPKPSRFLIRACVGPEIGPERGGRERSSDPPLWAEFLFGAGRAGGEPRRRKDRAHSVRGRGQAFVDADAGDRRSKESHQTVAASVYVDRRDHPANIALRSPKAHPRPEVPGRRSQAAWTPQPPPRASSSILPGVQLKEARAGPNPISSPQGRRQPPAPAAIRTAPARSGVGQVKSDQFAPRLYQHVA